MRRHVTFAFNEDEIPNPLFSRRTDVSFAVENSKWDFQKNKTTWANTDAMLGRNSPFKDKSNRQIAIYMDATKGADEANTKRIQDLGGFNKQTSPRSQMGPIEDKILKLLVYGDPRKRETLVRILENNDRCGRFRKAEKEKENQRRRII